MNLRSLCINSIDISDKKTDSVQMCNKSKI